MAAGLFLCAASLCVWATPITPTRDDEVIDVLPATSGSRSDDRRLRQQLSAQPRNVALALSVAKRYLDQAHELGDPRFAGLATAALQGWANDAAAPSEVLMMRATLQQYLHEFDASVKTLEQVLARPGSQRQPQAWLTLATVRRVQGRYADSDQACKAVAQAGAVLYAEACRAENDALRGRTEAARSTLAGLLATPGLPDSTRSWLSTTLAELEQRDGRVASADADFRAVLKLGRDSYAEVAYADFLIEQGRFNDALKVLQDSPRTDAVLLRLAIAGSRAKTPGAERDVAEMRERIDLANQRPDAKKFHGREQAMFALAVEHDPARALGLARGNVEMQREAIDVLVLAQAARASGNAAAIEEARQLKSSIGLHDRRIDALL